MITEKTTETLKQTSNAMILPLLIDILFCTFHLKLNGILQVFITNSVNYWSANRTITR